MTVTHYHTIRKHLHDNSRAFIKSSFSDECQFAAKQQNKLPSFDDHLAGNHFRAFFNGFYTNDIILWLSR